MFDHILPLPLLKWTRLVKIAYFDVGNPNVEVPERVAASPLWTRQFLTTLAWRLKSRDFCPPPQGRPQTPQACTHKAGPKARASEYRHLGWMEAGVPRWNEAAPAVWWRWSSAALDSRTIDALGQYIEPDWQDAWCGGARRRPSTRYLRCGPRNHWNRHFFAAYDVNEQMNPSTPHRRIHGGRGPVKSHVQHPGSFERCSSQMPRHGHVRPARWPCGRSAPPGNSRPSDRDARKANIRVLKINCVDFEEACRDQRVQGFPTIKLFRRGAKDSWEYNGARTVEGLAAFAREEVGKRHMHTGVTYHEIFSEGCRITGKVEVARVPGTVHFQAAHTNEKTLNLAFTNVSHKIHSFTFGSSPEKGMNMLPSEFRRHANPLDGKTFTVDKFHQAPHHFIKVVHTRFEKSNIRSYQQTHQWSVRTVPRKTVPQAKFSYDLSPVEVIVRKGPCPSSFHSSFVHALAHQYRGSEACICVPPADLKRHSLAPALRAGMCISGLCPEQLL